VKQIRLVTIVVVTLAAPFMRFNSYMTTQNDRDQALQLATVLHQQMAAGDIDGIYNDADPALKEKVNLEQHRAFFSRIARKVGSPMDCRLGETQVRWALLTKQIRTQCTTQFSGNATEVETLTWSQTGDQYHLYYYYIDPRGATGP